MFKKNKSKFSLIWPAELQMYSIFDKVVKKSAIIELVHKNLIIFLLKLYLKWFLWLIALSFTWTTEQFWFLFILAFWGRTRLKFRNVFLLIFWVFEILICHILFKFHFAFAFTSSLFLHFSNRKYSRFSLAWLNF